MVFFYVRVVEVERLKQVIEPRGLGPDNKGVERVVIPHLRQAEDEGAVAGDVLYGPLVRATGGEGQAAEQAQGDEFCLLREFSHT